MDLTVLNVAVPELSADLKPSGSQLLWIIELPAVEQDLALKGESGDSAGRAAA
jgi:DHA2 family multidrug resistance protein-like MFS transporter